MADEALKTSQAKPRGRGVLLVFLVIFALGFAVIGSGMIVSGHAKEKGSILTEGEIVSYRKASHAGKRRFSPVVEYQAGGEVLAGGVRIWTSTRPFKTGARVTVGYDPEHPKKFYIKEYDLKKQYQIGAVFLAVSAVIILMTAIFAMLEHAQINEKKKEEMEAKLIMAATVLFVFGVFLLIAGVRATLCVFSAMGIFGFFAFRDNRRWR